MKRLISCVVLILALAGAAQGNPIPIPRPASMPLEEMWIQVQPLGGGYHVDFTGDFTFNSIPSDVTSMRFPMPLGSSAQSVSMDSVPLPWASNCANCSRAH